MQDTSQRYQRYERQVIIPSFGAAGQEKLARTTMLVVGCGGLGCTILQVLTRVGIGRLIVCDDDAVELNDLHRQILYSECDLGHVKVNTAAEKLRQINTQVTIEPHNVRVDEHNLAELAEPADLILDATDNLQSRAVLNTYAVSSRRDWIYGGCTELQGTVMLIRPNAGPCLGCIFGTEIDRPSPSTATPIPVLGSLPVVVGTIEATEAIKYVIWPERRPTTGKLITIDLHGPRIRTIEAPARDPECPICRRPN